MALSDTTKQKLLSEAEKHLAIVGQRIDGEYAQKKESYTVRSAKIGRIASVDQLMIEEEIISHLRTRLDELERLKDSPYFVRCDVKFDDESVPTTLFFSKFLFSPESIYSWVAPAATIRFEKPGHFSFPIPNGKTRSGELLRKDQFMISENHVRYMTTESSEIDRTLVYQEYLSRKKTGFMLPEIVEQMERSQDIILRAHHQGPFLISGPAGSGKTTLALHRIAFLAQTPETAPLFPGESIIVFVQDERTRDYFAHLLPELGVDNIIITTFSEWVLGNLGFKDIKLVNRYGDDEDERDQYEYAKYRAVTNQPFVYKKDPFLMLGTAYKNVLDKNVLAMWRRQREDRVLDRMDLTILLKSYYATKGPFRHERISHEIGNNGGWTTRFEQVPLQYSLMFIDEVENYLPEQVSLLKHFVNPRTNAMVYVGDLAQQTALCTIRSWESVGEEFPEGRSVVLEKVYRSTREILTYISSIGYKKIHIPESAPSGPPVREITTKTQDEEIAYIQDIAKKSPDTVIGVLAKSSKYLDAFRAALIDHTNVQILTISEAQGVEFEIMCLVGVEEQMYIPDPSSHDSDDFMNERRRVSRDLIYVALTRAMREIHVFGKTPLTSIVNMLAQK
jgi:DNA helicase IV